MNHSEEVSWQLDGITMAGTFVRPEGEVPHPAVVMVAGSGPTDRDWTSPLLPGSNGSAPLLAEALAGAGIASLRYDKRASGPHVAANLPTLIGKMSMRSHLDELTAAVGVLAHRDDVDADRIAGLGNSEGCLHLLHYAAAQAGPDTSGSLPASLAGLVLAAPPGRSIGEVLLTQLSIQLNLVPGGADLFSLVEEAAARYSAGEPMDADPRLPEQVRMVLASFETPANLPFARELWSEDAAASLADVDIPALIVIGRKDAQVDAALDGEPLQGAASGKPNIAFAFPENANHVLKEDLRSFEDRSTAPAAGYNEPATRLDPTALAEILSFLEGVLAG